MKLYIVRHGQTLWNKERRMQGSKNSPLTKKGIKEAQLLNSKLEDLDLDIIYTSPLGRTLETTAHVKGNMNTKIQVLDEIQELDFGILEGRVLEEVTEEYPEKLYNLWNNPEEYKTKTGETYPEFFKRVKKGLNEIKESGHKNILIVTHGVVISAILTILKGEEYNKIWDNPIVPNTSITSLEYRGNQWIVHKVGDISHLE